MASSVGTRRPVPPAAPRRGRSQTQTRQAPRHSCLLPRSERRPCDLSCSPPRLLETYNSLRDKHLVEYFNNTRIRQHLQRSGLISRSGRIILEKEYRLNTLREEHLRYVRECLAGTVFDKALDIQRHHQPGAKKKPAKNGRKEKVREVKAEPSRRPVGNARFMHFPHPPPGPSNRRGLFPPLAREAAGRSRRRTSRQPHTAPGYLQHSLHFPPLPISAAAEAVKTPTSEKKCPAPQISKQPAGREERSEVRGPNVVEYVTDTSPIVNISLMPAPPPPQQKARSWVTRGRQLRPITVPSEAEQPPRKNSGVVFRSPVRNGACVTMAFVGKNLRLSGKDADDRNEIAVYQQHCGGENLCVYKGSLLEGETFQFISRRHQGFPFSLTFFVNGLSVDRLSCCCEFRHQRPSTVGGRRGHFRFLSVEGASPCYRCVIAMGLDKKPVPPKEKMEEDHEENHMGSGADGVCMEPSKSSTEQKTSKDSVLVILPGVEASVQTIEDKMETEQENREEEGKKLSDCEHEDSQEDIGKNEYDEDIEAEERQIDDQMNGTSESPSGDKKPDLDIEKESETLSEKALEVSDSEKAEDDRYSDSDFQDDEQASLSQAEADEEEKKNPEDLRVREDTGSLDEDTTATRHQSPEVPGELKQAESVESLLEEDKERDASSRGYDGEDFVPSESGVSEAEDSNEEWPESDEGSVLEDYSPVQAETATAAGHGRLVNSEPDDSCTDVEEEVVASGEYEASEAPDGTFLAEGTRTLDVQEAAEKVAQERQIVVETQALEEADFVEEEGEVCTKEAGEEVEWVGDLLPQEEEVAVLQAEGQLVVEESAPEESAVAEGHPKGQGTGKGREFGAEVAPGEQGVMVEWMESEAELEEQGCREEELSGAGEELGWEEGRMQPEGWEGAEELSESDEEDSEVEESEGEENMEEGGFSGEDDVASAVFEGEENLEEGEFEGKDVVSALCVGEENLEEGEFEEKDGASALCAGEENLEEGEFEGKDVASALCAEEEDLEEGEFEGQDVASALCAGEENLEEGEFEGKDVASALCVGEENLEEGEFEGQDVGEFEGIDLEPIEISDEEEDMEERGFRREYVLGGAPEREEDVDKGGFAGKDVVAILVSGGDDTEEGAFAGKDVVAGAVSEREEMQ
ncbi:glutamate-rich protein 3 [Strix aluco]|uniref:glutamate-rich protein 3 n=1 Tax=Strix aluco TaxID=111821 RepID=UPI003DA418AE